MGLETVKEEVIRSAKEQESAILAEARKEASRIMKEAEARVKEMEEAGEAKSKKAIEAAKKQALASAEIESKKMILETKKQAIDRVFEEVKKSLDSMDEKKREAIIKNLLEKAGKELDVSFVYCNKGDSKFLKGVKTENISTLGGIISENNEKTIRVDYTFETSLESIKESEMQNINRLLFG